MVSRVAGTPSTQEVDQIENAKLQRCLRMLPAKPAHPWEERAYTPPAMHSSGLFVKAVDELCRRLC